MHPITSRLEKDCEISKSKIEFNTDHCNGCTNKNRYLEEMERFYVI